MGWSLMLGLETRNYIQPPTSLERRGKYGAQLLRGIALQEQSYQGR